MSWPSHVSRGRRFGGGPLQQELVVACVEMGELTKARAHLAEVDSTHKPPVLLFFEGEWELADKRLTAKFEQLRTTGHATSGSRGVRQNLQLDYVYLNRLPAAIEVLAQLPGRFADCDEIHPHKRFGMRLPEQQIRDEILHARDLSKKGDAARQLDYAERTAIKALSTGLGPWKEPLLIVPMEPLSTAPADLVRLLGSQPSKWFCS